MQRLLASAAAIVALVAPAKAMEQSKANASLVVIVAMYRDKCGTPPDAISKTQLILIKNHDYTNDMQMDALIDVADQMNKMGTSAWCATMAEGFQRNKSLVHEKLKDAR
jgi:hypothetical protein